MGKSKNKGVSASLEYKIKVAKGRESSERTAKAYGYGGILTGGAVTISDSNLNYCLVCILEEYEDKELMSIAVHEAVHCAAAWCTFLGEDEPGEETVAYMTQACFDAIVEQL